jgi:4-amino-4-deoxy-L-arabinose transferase-like glycosyltransferase
MKKQTKTKLIKNLFWVLPVLIVLLSLLIRFSPMLGERDYWYDEAFTGILLKQPFPEMNQMIFDDVHPPLHYWLAKPWSAMFGYSPAGIRSLSVVFGVLTVISLFWIGQKMFNKRAGLLASIIGAFSPFAIQYSQEARMYTRFGF